MSPSLPHHQPSPRPLVGVSFKMYFDIHKTKAYIDETIQLVQQAMSQLAQPIDIFVIPDFVTLIPTQQQISTAQSPILLGAQDVYSQEFGAFTGEVSPKVLSQVGVRFVEIGHAERRKHFGETDDHVASKAAAITRNGMVPLVCIGEVSKPDNIGQLTDADIGKVVQECWTQIQPVLDNVQPDSEVVFAYEPVWAIGQAQPASPEYVVRVTQALRAKYVNDYVQTSAARSFQSFRILYGGSAGPGLFEKLASGVDGLFLGRFAHQPRAFIDTIKEIAGSTTL